MKKGKVFSKGQVVAVLMIIALGGAVWVNMKFSSSEKYLGEAKYVSNNSTAIQTSTNVDADDTDYFKTAKKEREAAQKEIQDTINETLKSEKLSDKDKEKIASLVNSLTSRIEQANNIETLLKAKGFNKAVAVVGSESVSVVVKSDGLTTAQTLQIQDIITNESGISLEKIKIVPVK